MLLPTAPTPASRTRAPAPFAPRVAVLVLALAACAGDTPSDEGSAAPPSTPDGRPDPAGGTAGGTAGGADGGADGGTGNGAGGEGGGDAPDGPDGGTGDAGADAGTPGTPPDDGPPGGGGEVPDTIEPGTLSPLPSPPLTPPPSADDEPSPARGPIDTATDFTVVDNPPRPPHDPLGEIDEAEFEAGLREPIVHAPPGLDLSLNRPPYFPELDNVTVRAGETLELHLAPIDPDGGVAGQYPNALPPGARYIDNFDTTRSLIWRPLEPDVGIREFTVFAVDPVEPALRVEYTVLIRVVMPSDPSTIENRPPGIDRIDPQTVRVGDPVVLGIKGTDPNGTVPALEIEGLPPGATIRTARDDPRIRFVRFVPDTPGTITLEVLARDAREPTLTARKTIVVEAYPPEHFARAGAPLRELAAARDFLIGYASTPRFHRRADGALYASIAAEEFNVVTAENSMKWDALNPLPGLWRWAGADNLLAHARANELIVHGHTLVWYTQLPAWVKETAPETREGHMREFIDRVLARYADEVALWDVVNESLEADGTLRDSIWHQAMGADYIDIAFRQARASAPEATLLYNEYDIGWAGPKADGLFRLLDALKGAGTPIDGVGFQMHVDAGFERFDELAENMRRVAALDLDVYVTELDVSMREGDTDADQARVFEGVLSTCLAEPRCKALQAWGFTDRYSWRRDRTPLIFDRDYAPKAAYRALQRRLGEN